MRLLHISDTHFHSGRGDNRTICARLESAANEFFLSDPDTYLLHTGDVTDDGGEAQYSNARRALRNLFAPGRILTVPGNHDYGYSGIFYSENCAQRFDRLAHDLGYPEPYLPKHPIVRVLRDTAGVRLATIGVNAVLETILPTDLSKGAVGQRQLGMLDAVLATLADVPKLVYLHFHPFDVGFGLELVDSHAFLSLLDAHRVELVCFGHKHSRGKWSGAEKGWPHVGWFVESHALFKTAQAWQIGVTAAGVSVSSAVIP